MNKPIQSKIPLAEPLDALLADIAIRVQLSASNYAKAVERYRAIRDHIEREGSQLHGKVALFHPQGSMAIGATISSKLENDEFDIDLIAVLDLPVDTPPHHALNLLERAIRGEPGSRYYDMTERCTRCIQVQYADGMHLDVTPMVRLAHTPEKWGVIFHAPERIETHHDATIIANPWGFAQHFLAATPADQLFQATFSERALAYDAAHYLADAEAEPVPDQAPVHAKSMAVVGLQLLKRHRNVRYDQREGRCPPSVMLAKLVADNAGCTQTLSQELIFQAREVRRLLLEANAASALVDVRNPTCEPDCFTDRWPGTLSAQSLFIADLTHLIEALEGLRGEADLSKMQRVLAELFGERATLDAVKALTRRVGQSIMDGESRHVPGVGRIVMPTPADVTALGAIASIPAIARATPRHTHFGSTRKTP
jgi:hypothetical protein